MATIKKYLENSNRKVGIISHEDQTVHGLKFRIVCHSKDNTKEQMIIQGEEEEINKFVAKHSAVVHEIQEQDIANIIASDWQPEERPCPTCGQMSTVEPFKLSEIQAVVLT